MLTEPMNWLLRWGEVIGGIGSVLLTGALVILYRQQKDILYQTFRANNRAILEVDDSGLSNEDLHLKVSNVGEGVGLGPEMIVAGIYTDSSGNVSTGVTTNRLNRLDRGEQNTPGSIRPDEHEIPLVSRFSLPSVHSGTRTEFFTAIRELESEDIEVARIHTWIRYSDLTEENRTQYVQGWEFELEITSDEVEEYLAQAAPMLVGEPELNPETLELDLSGAETGKERTVI